MKNISQTGTWRIKAINSRSTPVLRNFEYARSMVTPVNEMRVLPNLQVTQFGMVAFCISVT